MTVRYHAGVVLMAFVVVVTAAARLLCAQQAAAQLVPTLPATLPASVDRLYGVERQKAWDATLEVLHAAGIGVESVDRADGTIITRSVDVQSKRFGFGVDVFKEPRQLRSARVQFELFVPNVEPARVYVGSIVDGLGQVIEGKATSDVTLRYYNVEVLGDWLLDRLGDSLRQQGFAIPRDSRKRGALSRSLVPDRPDPCLDLLARGRPVGPIEGKLEDPVKIRGEEPVFPRDMAKNKSSGIVIILGDLWEDGFLFPTEITRGASDAAFNAAAAGAVSLWRYRPARDSSGCGISVLTSVTVNFKLR